MKTKTSIIQHTKTTGQVVYEFSVLARFDGDNVQCVLLVDTHDDFYEGIEFQIEGNLLSLSNVYLNNDSDKRAFIDQASFVQWAKNTADCTAVQQKVANFYEELHQELVADKAEYKKCINHINELLSKWGYL